MNSFLLSSMLLLMLFGMVLSRPTMQRIVINNHEWEVPNEPGWDAVIKDVQLLQHVLHKCKSATECLQIINAIRAVFDHHPVSRKYLESGTNDADDLLTSIFKWG